MEIVYITEDLIAGWRRACEAVAAEKVYLGRIELPPFDPQFNHARRMIASNWPMYCAVENGEVAGWIDITPEAVPECSHRGVLGIGIQRARRGKGVGKSLMKAALDAAPLAGLSKVELTVYASNTAAIGLFERFGFEPVGTIRDFRRLDDVIYDALLMEKFLD